jgi:hypothetical protein
LKTNPALTLTLLVLAVASSACRDDMHNQPKYIPLRESDFFGDRRSARPKVEDTVARGYLRIDDARYTGKVNGEDIDYFPWAMTKDDIVLGQYRYDIYCSPCHSRLGDGNGLIVQRGFRRAASYHTAKLIAAPAGHFFDVITNGYGAMPSYASRIPVDDRWRIIAFIRALQLSQAAKLEDAPADIRQKLQAEGPTAEIRVTEGATATFAAAPPESIYQSPGNPAIPTPYSGVIPPSYRSQHPAPELASARPVKAQGAK